MVIYIRNEVLQIEFLYELKIKKIGGVAALLNFPYTIINDSFSELFFAMDADIERIFGLYIRNEDLQIEF